MPKLFPFPDVALRGLLKKAMLSLPPHQRTSISSALQSKTKPNPLLEKARTVVISLVSARQSPDEEFEQDLVDGIDTLTLNAAEFALFDGLLGAKLSMALDIAKKGIKPERLSALRERLAKAYAQHAPAGVATIGGAANDSAAEG